MDFFWTEEWKEGATVDKNNVVRVAKNEYIKWISNPKMIIFVVMLIFSYDYVILELIEAAEKMGKNLQILEGFIGISNSQLLLMIIPIVFVGVMGDFPKVDGNAMFYIHRVGKINWLLGQILFAVMASATYLVTLLGFCMITFWGKSFMKNDWSEVTTKYYIFAPNEYAGKVANLTTGRLYNNILPIHAAIHILGLMFLFLILISMMLLAGFICKIRLGGIIVTTGILCLGNVLAYMENGVRWLLPTAHAILEIHFDELYREPVMDLRISYLYYFLWIMICFMAAYLKIDKYDFSKIQEMEE